MSAAGSHQDAVRNSSLETMTGTRQTLIFVAGVGVFGPNRNRIHTETQYTTATSTTFTAAFNN